MKEAIKNVLVPILCVVFTAALTSQINSPWASWMRWSVSAAGAGVTIYLFVTVYREVVPWMAGWLASRRTERAIHDDVRAVARMMRDAGNRSFTMSAGSVLNALCAGKVASPEVVNAHGAHLGTLVLAVDHVCADMDHNRLRAGSSLERLVELHRGYVRLSCELAMLATRVEQNDVVRDWAGIRDRGNSISDRLTELTTKVAPKPETARISAYFENIPPIERLSHEPK